MKEGANRHERIENMMNFLEKKVPGISFVLLKLVKELNDQKTLIEAKEQIQFDDSIRCERMLDYIHDFLEQLCLPFPK